MRVLLLTHTFNSLSQRLFVELRGWGHETSVEFDINDGVTSEAVALLRPDLIIAPFLKRAIPESVWARNTCLVVHPGIPGDRGPAALDWAILEGVHEWGVTLLQADAEMDAGDIWESSPFPMRDASKGSLYRHEVTEGAVSALAACLPRLASSRPVPQIMLRGLRGRAHPPARQSDRAIDWPADGTNDVLRKIRSADGQPGVLDSTFGGGEVYLYGAHRESCLRGAPGRVIARRDGAICRATADGAVWITHLRRRTEGPLPALKLPAADVLGESLEGVPESVIDPFSAAQGETYREIYFEEDGAVGYLHFPFYNGAMSTRQCAALREAFVRACGTGARVIVLMGGHDFWSNGIHLGVIEASASPADESWRNINAMDDLAREMITARDQVVVSALRGNAGAGGVFLSLAADFIYARRGVVLNPHYKGMGNLYGSEYWTYLLPRRVGADRATELTELRLPIGTGDARRLGLIDDSFGRSAEDFVAELRQRVRELAVSAETILSDKRRRLAEDESVKSLESYRLEELEQLKLNFYGFDPSYHVARYNFVYRIPHSRTPPHLAVHRRLGFPGPSPGVAGRPSP